MDIEVEILDLKRRVGDLEGAVNVLAGHIGRIHPDLKALSDVTSHRFDDIKGLVGRIDERLETLTTHVWSLRDDLPYLVARALSSEHGHRDSG